MLHGLGPKNVIEGWVLGRGTEGGKPSPKHFDFHENTHLTASILYCKGYSLAVIQAVLRRTNPNTTSRYLRTHGLEQVRNAIEERLKASEKVIPFRRKTLGAAASEG